MKVKGEEICKGLKHFADIESIRDYSGWIETVNNCIEEDFDEWYKVNGKANILFTPTLMRLEDLYFNRLIKDGVIESEPLPLGLKLSPREETDLTTMQGYLEEEETLTEAGRKKREILCSLLEASGYTIAVTVYEDEEAVQELKPLFDLAGDIFENEDDIDFWVCEYLQRNNSGRILDMCVKGPKERIALCRRISEESNLFSFSDGDISSGTAYMPDGETVHFLTNAIFMGDSEQIWLMFPTVRIFPLLASEPVCPVRR